ncbi:MAG: hypothetical protein K0U98_02535 [Deltaproteobacteria bacterium]|nr:hypothetical protein [Deltaproteobacteria bacterium]
MTSKLALEAPRPSFLSPKLLGIGLGVLVLVWLCITGLLAHRVAGQTVDDFFITFRYAQNLLAGEGFVFNPGERVFGTTAPGWGLALALGSGLSRIPIPVLATIGAAVSLLGITTGLLFWGWRSGRWPEASFAGSLVLTSTFLWVHNGSEAFEALALMLLAAFLAGRWPGLAGVVLGWSVWMRPEALLAVGLLGLLLWWETGRLPRRYGLSAAVVIAIGAAWARFYFGSPLPNTLGAKRLQSAWNPEAWHSGLDFWPEALRWLDLAYAGPFMPILAVGGLLGSISLWRSGSRALRLLAAFSVGLLVAYPLLGVPFYTWYAIPTLLAWIYGLAFLAGDLVRLARRGTRSPLRRVLVPILVTLLILPLAAHTLRRAWDGYHGFRGIPQTELYHRAGAWIRDHSEPGEDLAYVEVGTLAFTADRPVRDLLGLVSPEALPFVAQQDLSGALLANPPMMVIYHSRLHGFMEPIRQQSWFSKAYEEIQRFEADLSGDTLVLYRRRSGISLPAPGNI